MPRLAPVEPSSYSVAQAAARIGVSRVTLWRWINPGRVSAQRLGHRTARISGEDLARLMLPHTAIQGLPANREAHVVQFYESDGYLVESAAGYLGAALRNGDRALVVATAAHSAEIEARLSAAGIELSARYTALDAAQTLEQFMVDGGPDRERFRDAVGRVVIDRTGQDGHLRVFGEMVAVLAAAGQYSAALQLEQLWNELLAEQPFALLCAYPIDVFAGEGYTRPLADVCDEHAHVVPTEGYTGLAEDDRLHEITRLQHKARSLEREVERRQIAEDQLRVALAAEQTARTAAEAALQLRDEFVSVASHELRTPLTTLSGYAQLVLRRFKREGELDPTRVVAAVSAINVQADKLGRLLGHLLDVARLDEDKLALTREPLDLSVLVAQVVAAARATGARHRVHVEAPTSLVVQADPLRLEQVLINLLDNAIKYSPDGDQIDVAVAPRGRATAEVSVRDRGLGIPRRRRQHIFERFYQAHSAGHRSGLGLGLYISRQIVELHGGQIRAEFPRGGGTRFIVRLPRG